MDATHFGHNEIELNQSEKERKQGQDALVSALLTQNKDCKPVASASPGLLLEMQDWRFPGDSVVKNKPANAGDVGSITGPERSHMP